MNFPMIIQVIGRILRIVSVLYLLPILVAAAFQDGTHPVWMLCMVITFIVGSLLMRIKVPSSDMFPKDGMAIVAIAWILLSVTCAVPYTLTGDIPNYIDAIFETVSGFTTTGSSVVLDVEGLYPSVLFWRSFTQYMGGMGILLMTLAIMPKVNKRSILMMRAEVPGPTVGKLASKMVTTARILYSIYISLTILNIVFLMLGGIPFFESMLLAFGSAGTGGFAIRNANIAYYHSTYIQIVVAVFTMLFGINFNIFFLFVMNRTRLAFRNEEFRAYLLIIFASTIFIAQDLMAMAGNSLSAGEAYRDSFFHVTSILTSTGYWTTNIHNWTLHSRALLMILMLIGACAGSTAAGLKISRVLILGKGAYQEAKRFVNPNRVIPIQMDGHQLPDSLIKSVGIYIFVYVCLFFVTLMILAYTELNLLQAFTATLSSLNNIGLEIIGEPVAYGGLAGWAKLFLCLIMLIGRLELFPILVLMMPSTWRKV